MKKKATARKNSQHVVKNPEGGWSVKRGGSTRATKVHKTQAAAIKQATGIAKSQRAELYIHGADGKIREKNSYGNDPMPPKDKK